MLNFRSILTSGAIAVAFATAGMADQIAVDLSSNANGSWCNVGGGAMYGCGSLPTGIQNYNGQTFNISNGPNGNAWFSSVAAQGGSTAQTLTLNVNVMNAVSVATLMNTFWGQSGVVLDTISFGFSDGSSITDSMTGNNTLRDYNNWVWTNSISAPTTGAWTDTSQRLDEQMFSLGADAGKDLTSITITDTGNQLYSRAFLAALTVDTQAGLDVVTTPEPGYLAFVGASLLGAGLLFRRRKA